MSRIVVLILSLFSFAGLFPANAVESYSVNGYVKDESGRPVAYAKIAVKNSDKAVMCRDNGAFAIRLPAGAYCVQVSMVGYKTAEKSIVVNADTKCNFVLEESALALDEVKVYGKNESRKLKESFFSVNALDIKSLAGSIANLDDAVGRSTGVKIRRQGGAGSDFDLAINGLSGNSIRYFIDGVPMDSRGSDIRIDNLPVSSVNRIEIYKGVVPGYLGSDALGGAVNIVTNQEKKNFLDVSVGGGSFHTYNADLNGQFVIPRTKILVRWKARVLLLLFAMTLLPPQIFLVILSKASQE